MFREVDGYSVERAVDAYSYQREKTKLRGCCMHATLRGTTVEPKLYLTRGKRKRDRTTGQEPCKQ